MICVWLTVLKIGGPYRGPDAFSSRSQPALGFSDGGCYARLGKVVMLQCSQAVFERPFCPAQFGVEFLCAVFSPDSRLRFAAAGPLVDTLDVG